MHSSFRSESPRIHITSLLVQVTPQGREAVMACPQLNGARTFPTASASKIAVILESAEESAVAATADALLALPGVLTVAIVSHLTESADLLAQEVE